MQYLEPEQYERNIAALVERTVAGGEIIGLSAASGRAVLMSEREYNALAETAFLTQDPRVAADILEAAGEEMEESIAEQDVRW